MAREEAKVLRRRLSAPLRSKGGGSLSSQSRWGTLGQRGQRQMCAAVGRAGCMLCSAQGQLCALEWPAPDVRSRMAKARVVDSGHFRESAQGQARAL